MKQWIRVKPETIRGEKNRMWKGDKVKQHSLHTWINDNFDRPAKCEICEAEVIPGKQFDWSNKDHKYTRIREEWQYVCRKCHMDYDIKNLGRKMPWSRKASGQWSSRFEKCITCGTIEVPYQAKGQCAKCYKADHYQRKKRHELQTN